MKKQLLSILLCLIMVVGLLPTAALAEEAEPPFNLATDLEGITIPNDLVTCICTKTGERKSYGRLLDGFSASTIEKEKEDDVWTVIISVKNKTYLEKFNQDMGCKHDPDGNYPSDFNPPIQFKLKYEQNKWMLHGEIPQGKELHFTCTDKHTAQSPAPTITEDDLAGLNIPTNLVTVKCQTTGDSKAYGRIPGGFDLSNATPYMKNGVLKAIVKLNLPAYKDKYDADTQKTHENAGVEGNTHAAFTLKYVNDKWELDGTFPNVVILVKGQRYTITFNGNGGTPSVTSMTTIDQKLPELPIATRSGRYSFDGWYTEKNGGTKITTATLFDKDTTVYAHWTYTGSTGGGVTTYPITVKSAKNGDVTASHKSAAKGTTITLTVDPDKSYVLDTLTVLDGKDKEIKLTEKNGKYTFTMPASKVTVAAMFKAEQSTGKNPFTDVPAGSYYEDAVIWAVDKGITTGTSATTFNPNGICTRAQAVTFLWRAAGSPAAKSSAMPFADVKAGSYYYDAVLWAVENGITKGTSDTMFSPDATCTRAQIVTFLYRAHNK